jgi:hypothetical protein
LFVQLNIKRVNPIIINVFLILFEYKSGGQLRPPL